MRVLIRRNLFLGGALYEPSKSGVEIPDQIGDRKVALYDPKMKPEDAKTTLYLPRDAVMWSEKAAKELVVEGIPLLRETKVEPVPLSAMTPGPSKAEAAKEK